MECLQNTKVNKFCTLNVLKFKIFHSYTRFHIHRIINSLYLNSLNNEL